MTRWRGLSRSALSQHLAKLQDEGLVTFRKQSQLVFCPTDEPKIRTRLHALHANYRPTLGVTNSKETRND